MKNKVLASLLVISMFAVIFSGCGALDKKANGSYLEKKEIETQTEESETEERETEETETQETATEEVVTETEEQPTEDTSKTDKKQSEEQAKQESNQEAPAQVQTPSDYTTVYMQLPDITLYVSNDGLKLKIGNQSGTYYTPEGVKAYFPQVGQIVPVDDNTVKILWCGCCGDLYSQYGIATYIEAQALAAENGYSTLSTVEDGITWFGLNQNYAHNLDWYYFTR